MSGRIGTGIKKYRVSIGVAAAIGAPAGNCIPAHGRAGGNAGGAVAGRGKSRAVWR